MQTAVLSTPRGNGKSWLAAEIITRALTPGDPLFVPGGEVVIVAGSIEQGRIPVSLSFVRICAGSGETYRYLDSNTRIGIVHPATNTRLRVVGSNAKTAMGLVGVPLVVADEPGCYEVTGGELMYDAIQTAQGKPGSPMRAIYIGTLSPAHDGWWHQLVAGGSNGSTYVQALQGDAEKWDSWHEIKRCNPLVAVSADFRKKLLEERDQARRDSRLKSRFLSYRLNLPRADEAAMLLTVEDWQRSTARELGEREGRPLVGVDLGMGRAWSTAVSIFPSGRVEALAIAPGIPDIEDQEKRDHVPRGTYQVLIDNGSLTVAEGLRVPPASMLWDCDCRGLGLSRPRSLWTHSG